MQYEVLHQLAQVPSHLNNTYRQIQALQELNKLTQLTWALPPLRGWAASPDFLLLIAEHAKQKQPNVILECSSGASTVVLAQSVKLVGQGRVLSLEHDPVYAQKTRDELKKQGLQDYATVLNAPLKKYTLNEKQYLWYDFGTQIENLPIDMLVIDGPPGSLNPLARYPAGPLLLPMLTKNGSVFLDDSDRADEQEIVRLWLDQFTNLKLHQKECEKGAVKLQSS